MLKDKTFCDSLYNIVHLAHFIVPNCASFRSIKLQIYQNHICYCSEGNIMKNQHFLREDHTECLRRKTNELKKITKDLPIYISDNEIIFFLLTRNDEFKSQVEWIINRYKRDYSNLIIGNVNYNST